MNWKVGRFYLADGAANTKAWQQDKMYYLEEAEEVECG